MPSEDSLSETCRESRLNNPDNVSKVNEHIRHLNEGKKKLIIFYPFLTRKFVKSKSQREYNVFFFMRCWKNICNQDISSANYKFSELISCIQITNR